MHRSFINASKHWHEDSMLLCQTQSTKSASARCTWRRARRTQRGAGTRQSACDVQNVCWKGRGFALLSLRGSGRCREPLSTRRRQGGGLAMRSLYKLAERGVPGSCCEEPHGSVLSCVLHIVLVSSLASLRYPAHVSTCQGATMLPALPRRCQQRQQLRAKVHCTVSVTSKYIAPNLRAKFHPH